MSAFVFFSGVVSATKSFNLWSQFGWVGLFPFGSSEHSNKHKKHNTIFLQPATNLDQFNRHSFPFCIWTIVCEYKWSYLNWFQIKTDEQTQWTKSNILNGHEKKTTSFAQNRHSRGNVSIILFIISKWKKHEGKKFQWIPNYESCLPAVDVILLFSVSKTNRNRRLKKKTHTLTMDSLLCSFVRKVSNFLLVFFFVWTRVKLVLFFLLN